MRTLPVRSDRIAVVGVLNVTPDSFSDGGRYTSLDDAVEHALQMRAEGADLIAACDLDAKKAEAMIMPLLQAPAGSVSIRQKLIEFAEAEGLPL